MRLPALLELVASGTVRSSSTTTPPRSWSEEYVAPSRSHGDDVGVLGDDPEARAVGLGVLVHGRVAAQEGEPLVGDALGEPVAVEQVDLAGLDDVAHVDFPLGLRSLS